MPTNNKIYAKKYYAKQLLKADTHCECCNSSIKYVSLKKHNRSKAHKLSQFQYDLKNNETTLQEEDTSLKEEIRKLTLRIIQLEELTKQLK